MPPEAQSIGTVAGVRESLVRVSLRGQRVRRNEMGFVHVGDHRLMGEVLRIRGDIADMQVFEDMRGVRIGDSVSFSGELLSATLGPGLLGQVYDGLQNPLAQLHRHQGAFLKRGARLDPVDRARRWRFTPQLEAGAQVTSGTILGTVRETILDHPIAAPFDLVGTWTLDWLAEGMVDGTEPVAALSGPQGRRDVALHQHWPIRRPLAATLEGRGLGASLYPDTPLLTGIRLIDSFFPVARGGTACIPGPFGAGKTVLLNLIARYAQADVVIVIACGERAGEVTETIATFSELPDPRTGGSLMDRTVLIANTSAMPVAARESSIFLGLTIGEYYRQLGRQVLILADSTSRWAQALREMSGFMEEIPGDEGFPAYLDSAIKGLYERAGVVRTAGGETGSLTLIGTVSPAGGNFEEPVTQATLGTVKAFLGLSADRAYRRAYPAVDPLLSWSRYRAQLDGWFSAHLGPDWSARIERLAALVKAGDQVAQLVRVTGEDGVTLEDYVTLRQADLVDTVFLQQNAMDPVDAYNAIERQRASAELLDRLVGHDWRFADKEAARATFAALASLFRDLNAAPWDSGAYRAQRERLLAMMTGQDA
jgi:V/A-type H+-transporting ATPase subunit A